MALFTRGTSIAVKSSKRSYIGNDLLPIKPSKVPMALGPSIANELTRDQLEKVGNAIIYLAERIKPLYKTKVLKLLYLLDEASVKETGIPMFALEYRAWRMGPVSKEIYVDIDDGPHLLKEYIHVVRDEHGDRVEPARPFDDGEFSDRDMKLLERIAASFGRHNARDLVDITHDQASLWYQMPGSMVCWMLLNKSNATLVMRSTPSRSCSMWYMMAFFPRPLMRTSSRRWKRRTSVSRTWHLGRAAPAKR